MKKMRAVVVFALILAVLSGCAQQGGSFSLNLSGVRDFLLGGNASASTEECQTQYAPPPRLDKKGNAVSQEEVGARARYATCLQKLLARSFNEREEKFVNLVRQRCNGKQGGECKEGVLLEVILSRAIRAARAEDCRRARIAGVSPANIAMRCSSSGISKGGKGGK